MFASLAAQMSARMLPSAGHTLNTEFPLASMPAVAANHRRLIVNRGLLFATAFLLHVLTRLPKRRAALVAVLGFQLCVIVLFLSLLTLLRWV